MKKILSFVLILVFLLPALLSCGSGIMDETETAGPATAATETAGEETPAPATEEKKPARVVQHLTERPNYVLHEGATADEMRRMAIKAVRDGLSVVWYPEKKAEYSYTSPNNGSMVNFRLLPTETYAGVPYSSSYTGLFQMLEYYDFETGMVSVPSDEIFTTAIGNDCAGGLLWGIAACVPTFEPTSDGYGRKSPNMVPVGPYKLVQEEKSSMKICEINGAQKMYESYACVKPADTVFTGGNTGIAGHYMMLLEEAHVVRNADGTINGKESTVTIQDQRRGHNSTSAQYVKEENGETHHYSGAWDTVHSFEYLFGEGYIPVTCKEFIGESPYLMPSFSLDKEEISSLEDLAGATLKSQYMICAFHIRLIDENGEIAYSRNKPTTYSEMTSGRLKNYPLQQLGVGRVALSRASCLKGTYTFEVDCIDASGTEFDIARFSVTL